MSNALNLLSVYNSESEDSENEVPEVNISTKRRHSRNDEESSNKFFKSERLPVPSILLPAENTIFTDQSELHGGRIRSFPHERGNWSTFIYIPYENNEIMQNLIKEIIDRCKPITDLQSSGDLHISLTKTVILRHHWIEPFIKLIGDHLSNIPVFLLLFDNLKIYCNEERTRTFIGLQIQTGHHSLLNLIDIFNKCLELYNLPKFYEDPSFHMSLAWCVGDFENALNKIIVDLNCILHQFMDNYSQSYWYIHVTNLICKTGNKLFNFNLNT